MAREKLRPEVLELLGKIHEVQPVTRGAEILQDALDAETTALEAVLAKTRRFLDVQVRTMLPNEHPNCGGQGCAHYAEESEAFAALDEQVDAINRALGGAAPDIVTLVDTLAVALQHRFPTWTSAPWRAIAAEAVVYLRDVRG